MGTFTWLKKGGPTVTFTPVTASEMMGNMVSPKHGEGNRDENDVC